MSYIKNEGDGKSSKDFRLCVDRYECALRDIVRHLARIAADDDYFNFQNAQKSDGMGAEQKEPMP
jgi:hypothetical protein